MSGIMQQHGQQHGQRHAQSRRTRSISFVALSIAIMAVSAWVTVPLGPIPFTLQMFAMAFAIVVLPPRQAIAAVAGYLVLGAVGVPVFSGFRGGLGALLGPTGGYLMGYLPGVALGAGVLALFRRRGMAARGASEQSVQVPSVGACMLAGLVFTAVAYLGGWAWYLHVSGVGPAAAFAATVAPFIAVDVVKVVAATAVARAVVRATAPLRTRGANPPA